jgi:hypothetical protein
MSFARFLALAGSSASVFCAATFGYLKSENLPVAAICAFVLFCTLLDLIKVGLPTWIADNYRDRRWLAVACSVIMLVLLIPLSFTATFTVYRHVTMKSDDAVAIAVASTAKAQAVTQTADWRANLHDLQTELSALGEAKPAAAAKANLDRHRSSPQWDACRSRPASFDTAKPTPSYSGSWPGLSARISFGQRSRPCARRSRPQRIPPHPACPLMT